MRQQLAKFSYGLLLVVTALSLPGLWGCDMLSKTDPITALTKEIMPPKPSEVARDAFNVYDADKRRQSIALLSATKFGGEEPYLRMYRLLVDDPDATVRAVCLKALGEHGVVDDVPMILRYLNDPTSFVRWEAVQALQKIYSPVAVPGLMKSVADDEDPDVRIAAATALAQYAEPRVFAALVGALDDPDFGVVAAAHDALTCLTGRDFGDDAAQWLAWSDKNTGALFQNQQQYRWQPFIKPRGFWDKVQFWRKYEPPPQPQLATGAKPTAPLDTTP